MKQQRVNYDEIAHLYDEPLRDHDVDENLGAFLAERPSLNPACIRILDMGCGTGKQLTANQSHYTDLPMFGLDLFLGMALQAKKRNQTAHWTVGDNMAAPFAANSFHYITNQFSYAHVQDKALFFAEVQRILMADGRFILTNIDPWHMPEWLIYRYFPAAKTLDYQDFLPAEKLVQLLRAAGMGNIRQERQQLTQTQTVAEFYSYASERHHASEFMAITDAAYTQGLQNIETDLKRIGPDTELSSQVCLFSISADKVPSL